MHISLDAALQRQPLLSTVGDKLLPSFPGAAAAYSLRSLNGDANDVVEVRRDADNEEKTFTAEGVSLELEDWVNGKLETTLPCDVATSAAAYSLRKVRSAYTGDAVRIRRASDDVEVDVAFDANGEVSDSSAIANVEDIELVSESGFATDTGGFASSISGALFSFGNTLDGESDVLFASFDGSGLLGLNFSTSDVAIGDVVTYNFKVYWPSTNIGGLPNLRIRSGNVTIGHTDVPMPSEDSWYTFSGQFTVTSNTPTALTLIAANSSGLTTGDVFAIASGSYGKQQDAGDTTETTLGEFVDTKTVDIIPLLDGTTFARFYGTGSVSTSTDTEFSFASGALGMGVRSTPTSVFDSSVTKDDDIEINVTVSGLDSGWVRVRDNANASASANVNLSNGTNTYTINPSKDPSYLEFNITSSAGGSISINSLNKISGTSYVVTWYDQSGNGYDATQDTAGSQPKIAEAGSLLADIDFAGDTFLQATSLQEQVPVSFFCVNRFDSTLSGFRPFLGNGILDSSSTGYGMYYHDPNNTFRTQVRIPSASSNVDNTATTVGNVKALTTSFITASTLTSFYNGGNESSAANAQGAVTPSRTLTIGGSETGSTPTVTRFFNGGISEVVLYSTDQSDNRFKIESNINNHYGIYTASHNGYVRTWYDQAATNYPIPALSAPQQNVSNQYETFTDASATGVTAGNTSGTAFAGFDFSGSNGDTVIVEFDFTVNSGSPSPTFQLKDSNYSVGKSNNQIVSSTGSYQIRFDATSDFDSIGFSEGDIGEFTISNFRVIRFYNGNDATQSTQNDQPKIVANGSYLGAVSYDGSGQDLVGSAPISVYDMSMFSVIKPANTSQFSASGSARILNLSPDGTNNRFYFGNSGTTLTARFGNTTQHFSSYTFTTDEILLSARADTSSASIFVSGSGAGSFTPTVGGTGLTTQQIRITGSPNDTFVGTVKEVIIYHSNQSANRTGIESNIADEYGITLS